MDHRHLAQFSQEPAGDAFTHHRVALEPEWTGHDLAHELRMLSRRGEHLVGLRRVQAHACLGEDVLAGSQCRQRDRRMQIGPGADDDGVDVRVVDEIFPGGEAAGNGEFPCHCRGGFEATVGDGDNLDVRDSAEARNVPGFHVRACADEADSQHGSPRLFLR